MGEFRRVGVVRGVGVVGGVGVSLFLLFLDVY